MALPLKKTKQNKNKKNPGLYCAPILLVTFFSLQNISRAFFHVTGESFASFFLKAVCGMKKWRSDFQKVKAEEWVRFGRQRGGSLRKSLGKGELRRSPYLYFLIRPSSCFQTLSLSLLPHFPHSNLQSQSVPFVLPYPWGASFFLPKQLIKYFPKQRTIYLEKNYTTPLTDKSSCRQLWF